MLQQWCTPAVSPIKLVEVDVSCVALHLPHRRSARSRYDIFFLVDTAYIDRKMKAVGHMDINCSSKELSKFSPPSGLTCGEYMQNYIAASGGYLTNPNDTSDCMFCSSRTTDQFLSSSFNIFYSHHWRNFGLLLAYICFNVRLLPPLLAALI